MRLRWLLLAVLAAGAGLASAGTPGGDRLSEEDAQQLARADALQAQLEERFYAGDYAAGAALARQQLALREAALGPDHPAVAASLNDLALLLQSQGDYQAAGPLYQRALAIRERELGSDHPEVATTLNNLAALLKAQGDYAGARPLYERTIALKEAALGDGHPDVAVALNNLGALLKTQGDYEAALRVYERSLAIRERALGPDHPEVAQSLSSLAFLLERRGDSDAARRHYERALAIREQAFGPDHPEVALTLNNLATLLQVQGDDVTAGALYRRALEAEEAHLSGNLALGSPRQKRLFMETLTLNTDKIVSFHLRDQPSPSTASMALETVLRRKGRLLEAEADTAAWIRAGLDDSGLATLEALSQALARREWLQRERPSQAALEDWRRSIADTDALIEDLQQQLAASSLDFAEATAPIAVADVQRRLPEGAALLELVVFRPFLPAPLGSRRWEARRYAAYVLTAEGITGWADLGEVAGIDPQLRALRAAIVGRRDPTEPAAALYAALLQPLAPHLPGIDALLVSPDGPLSMMPWDVLVDGDGRPLADRFELTTLTSGRDLLRLDRYPPAHPPPLLIADVDFDGVASAEESEAAVVEEATLARGERGGSWSRLPGTRAEGEALAALLAEGLLLSGRDATETALKQAPAPSVLHIATHGYFLSDLPQETPEDSRGLTVVATQHDRPRAPSGNPLLRSGLVLAGANGAPVGEDNGYLSAAEVAQMDLRGTELVVLSACETGVGEVTNGDGVQGLRRALVLAGSEAQVLSLWKVDDDATRALMVDYYQRLIDGEGRSEALRGAKEGLRSGAIGDGRWTHPYYWAAFVPSGDWRPLDKPLEPARRSLWSRLFGGGS